jgi:hypothetical protein
MRDRIESGLFFGWSVVFWGAIFGLVVVVIGDGQASSATIAMLGGMVLLLARADLNDFRSARCARNLREAYLKWDKESYTIKGGLR